MSTPKKAVKLTDGQKLKAVTDIVSANELLAKYAASMTAAKFQTVITNVIKS